MAKLALRVGGDTLWVGGGAHPDRINVRQDILDKRDEAVKVDQRRDDLNGINRRSTLVLDLVIDTTDCRQYSVKVQRKREELPLTI